MCDNGAMSYSSANRSGAMRTCAMRKQHPNATRRDDDLSAETLGIETIIDLDHSAKAVGSLPLDGFVLHKGSDANRRRVKVSIDDTLKDAQALFDGWAMYSRKAKQRTMNNSLLLIPETAPPAVVLDAREAVRAPRGAKQTPSA
jgi:hypothetical protein